MAGREAMGEFREGMEGEERERESPGNRHVSILQTSSLTRPVDLIALQSSPSRWRAQSRCASGATAAPQASRIGSAVCFPSLFSSGSTTLRLEHTHTPPGPLHPRTHPSHFPAAVVHRLEWHLASYSPSLRPLWADLSALSSSRSERH
jgi:hypothetical protein